MHERIEAMKLAYSDLRRYDADPRTYDVPVAQLLSKEYAKQARGADRSGEGELRRAAGAAGRERHDLSDRRG